MLEIDRIDVFYEDLQALWGISLNLKEGEILALVGSNGAGKTTLLKTISGLLRPSKGRIALKGRRIDREPANKIVDLGICLVPEGKRLFPRMSVLENLELGAFITRARRVKDETIKEVYAIFPTLKERENQMAGSLSGGEQQMLAIARGIMSRPEILLLDEVSLGLAPIVVEEMFKAIQFINESGVTVLLIEQNVYLALDVSARGYIIENGRIIGEGESRFLLNDKQVKKAYLG